MIELEKGAPVKHQSSIEINAPISIVWNVMTDVSHWPLWNSDIKSAEISAEFKEGSIIRWKAGPGSITSKLLKVNEYKEISWEGRMMGIYAIHVWKLEKSGNSTIVTTAESWSGFIPRLLKKTSKGMLVKAIDTGLCRLKIECEKKVSAL